MINLLYKWLSEYHTKVKRIYNCTFYGLSNKSQHSNDSRVADYIIVGLFILSSHAKFRTIISSSKTTWSCHIHQSAALSFYFFKEIFFNSLINFHYFQFVVRIKTTTTTIMSDSHGEAKIVFTLLILIASTLRFSVLPISLKPLSITLSTSCYNRKEWNYVLWIIRMLLMWNTGWKKYFYCMHVLRRQSKHGGGF